MIKRIINLVLVLSMVTSLINAFPITVSAATNGFYTYIVTNGEATITDCDTRISGSVTIPSTLGGYPVTKIGNKAFFDCFDLTSIIIPDSVLSIGDYAFYCCNGVTNLTIGNGVTNIGFGAFLWCSSLTYVTLGKNVKYIGEQAFFEYGDISAVYYAGSAEDWANINIGSLNNRLKRATIYYNTTPFNNQNELNNAIGTPMNYMPADDAKIFMAFIYNSRIDKFTDEILSNDMHYKLLTGQLSGDKASENAAKISFLSFLDKRICYTLEITNTATSIAIDSINTYFNKYYDDYTKDLVDDIFGDNVLSTMDDVCKYGSNIYDMANNICDFATNPTKFVEDVVAITNGLFYSYGTNVKDLYTYFNVALKNIHHKGDEYGTYEMLMWATKTELLKNPFSYVSSLVPGITHWIEWIDEMDYWAEFVEEMKSSIRSKSSVLVKQSVNEQITDNTPITDSEILYNITFDSNCTDVSNYTYRYSTNQQNWHVPTMERTGYIFCGWFYDQTCSQEISKTVTIDSDKTFYAKWQKRNMKITFNSNCNYISNISVNIDMLYDKSISIPNLKRTGYVFEGWYFDNACTKKLYSPLSLNEDLVLYAKWHSQFNFTKTDISINITGINDECINDGLAENKLIISDYIDELPVTTINEASFINNQNVTSINLPKFLQSIGDSSFKGCTNLKTIILNNSVTSIGVSAFEDCSSLTDVYFQGSEAQWKNILIESGNNQLNHAQIHFLYDANAPQIKQMIVKKNETSKKLYISVETVNIPQNAKVFIASYNDDRLLEVKLADGIDSEIELSSLNVDEVKCFVWDENISPLCKCKRVISRNFTTE